MGTRFYDTDLTDAAWPALPEVLPAARAAPYSHLMWFENERCCRFDRLCSQVLATDNFFGLQQGSSHAGFFFSGRSFIRWRSPACPRVFSFAPTLPVSGRGGRALNLGNKAAEDP